MEKENEEKNEKLKKKKSRNFYNAKFNSFY